LRVSITVRVYEPGLRDGSRCGQHARVRLCSSVCSHSAAVRPAGLVRSRKQT
jgi:hypothetical protein